MFICRILSSPCISLKSGRTESPRLVALGRRYRSYLSPPFLLDDYIPRYQLISSIDAAKKRSEAYAHLSNCNLCPRLCGVNRFEKTGVCLIGADVKVNTIAPHFGEEPCLQGHNGSGSVFFSGCNMRYARANSSKALLANAHHQGVSFARIMT
jgi:putative pyruvate formate lyase activating enzyme